MLKSNLFFSKKLISWYLIHKRDLPWRRTQLPYHVWLSEIILQRTRVDQGLPYYKTFVSAYPSIKDLANATEEEVLKLWQGLGYYSRARNLYSTAKFITNELNGEFPSSYSGLIKLKGVGDYTASAIASICFNEASAVVDGNVYRVLLRMPSLKASNLAKKTLRKREATGIQGLAGEGMHIKWTKPHLKGRSIRKLKVNWRDELLGKQTGLSKLSEDDAQ